MSHNKNLLFQNFQNAYIKYFNELHAFFSDKQIIYFATGSTLLGASLDQDFLLNEDSIHIAMLYEDYLKFLNLQDLPEHFKLVVPKECKDPKYATNLNLQIDDPNYLLDGKPLLNFFIHPIVGAPENESELQKQKKALERNKIRMAIRSHQKRNNLCSIIIWFLLWLFPPYKLEDIVKIQNRLIFEEYDYNKTDKCSFYYQNKLYNDEPLKLSVNFKERSYYMIDRVFYFGPKKSEELLHIIFPEKYFKNEEEKNNLATMNFLTNTNFFFNTETEKNKVSQLNLATADDKGVAKDKGGDPQPKNK